MGNLGEFRAGVLGDLEMHRNRTPLTKGYLRKWPRIAESWKSWKSGGQKRVPNWRIIKYHRNLGIFGGGQIWGPPKPQIWSSRTGPESRYPQNGPQNGPQIRTPSVYRWMEGVYGGPPGYIARWTSYMEVHGALWRCTLRSEPAVGLKKFKCYDNFEFAARWRLYFGEGLAGYPRGWDGATAYLQAQRSGSPE